MSTLKNTIYYPNRCKFFIDTNNLVNSSMLNPILDKFDDDAIERLNEVLKGIKFLVGGKQWHQNQRGYLKAAVYEYNFNDRTILVFLSKIFELGFKRWKRINYGSLKRFVWESFCHEIIMLLTHITKLDLFLAKKAKNYYLDQSDEKSLSFLRDLFNYKKENLPRINFIKIDNLLWNESLPNSLGFLNVLYSRKISKLKKTLPYEPVFIKVKFFNELRKVKLNHKYEYNLSELINYCIHSEHFEKLYSNIPSYDKLQREFYNKAKRIILKFFEQYEIINELDRYVDSANRTHYFLSHKTFERVKSVCLQTCIAKIKNQVLEEYKKFRKFYSKCPICLKKQSTQITCENIFFNSKYRYFKEILLKKMNDVKSLDLLNSPDYYFGVPCDHCFQLTRNIQGKFSELNLLQKFILKFDTCPICGQKNHIDYLTNFYNDENNKALRDHLINNMDLSQKSKKFKIDIGIPCCNCFDQFFEEESNIGILDISYLREEL
ncbi:MAG: hypothetical protein EU532_06515 [Promethearchaeota archaeon]|nr:MAG: hypothetical protein EU532_06515 [Candidatus Lokiarchaeota archaeon]